MVSSQEAFQIVQSVILTPEVEEVDILSSSGRVLAESIVADRDFPPFNRVAMDGIALRAEEFNSKGQVFVVENVQAAGSAPLTLKNPGYCIEVMTGAVLPQKTNAVVRYEDVELSDGNAKVLIEKIEINVNIHLQGQDAKKDDELLKKGRRISSAEVALIASVGKKLIHVFEYPKTAVVSSGDELVEIDEVPQAHQIRKSNAYALQSAMLEMGWRSESFHLVDNEELIKKNLRTILERYDVIILSGGVSKGKFDFIPAALEELGIQRLFHQVSQRPGKPFWFGATNDRRKIVFALPGNPVSTYLCFHKYIKPWILKSFGVVDKPFTATLSGEVNFKPPLTYFLQVRAELKDGKLLAYPHPGGGSGDFANLSEVDGFLELPLEKSVFKAGEVYSYIPFR